MGKKRASSSAAGAGTPKLLIDLADAEAQLRDRIAKGNAIIETPPSNGAELESARQQYYTWDEYNSALLGRLFSTPELVREYSFWGIAVIAGRTSLGEDIAEFMGDVSRKIRRLESVIERLPLYTPSRGVSGSPKMPTSEPLTPRNVFIVHGRNNELKETVARYIAQLDLTPIILHEQASAGATIIEKFESASDACFAVVLLTPDDVGCLAPAKSMGDLKARARQNVIFEWGFFVAHLGRRKVCALVPEGVEMPSDMHGIVYVSLDQNGAWKMLLARELKAASVNVDLNRAI